MQKEDIGSAWNLTADLGNGRSLSVMFNMAQGVSKEEMNAEVDKLRGILDRQQAQSALVAVKQELDREAIRLESAVQDLADIDAKYSTKGGPSAQERTQRDTAVKTIETMKKNLEYKKSVLEDIKKEAS